MATLVLCGAVRAVPGCGNGGDLVAERLGVDPCTGVEALTPAGTTGTASSALSVVPSCSDLPELLRAALVEQARRKVMAARCQALSTDCASHNSNSGSGFGCLAMKTSSEEDMAAPAGASNSGEGGATQYSTTNTQELGVDEADFIKNDGQYIYAVAGGELQIIAAWPAADMAVISSTPVEGEPQALYVYGDRAVVYSYDPSHTCYDSYNYESWYGYGCVSADTTTLVTVLDITDRTLPVLERRIELKGAYVSSRRIDGAVYTVVALPGPQVSGLRYSLGTSACSYESSDDLDADVAELIDSNTRIIQQAQLGDVLPQITDTAFLPDGTAQVRGNLFGGCESILVPPYLSGTSFLTVLSFDVANLAPARVSSIVGEQGVVYASSGSLYVASVDNPGSGQSLETTTLHRFALQPSPAAALYQASGVVGGRVLNQFSMGEHDGFLRLATTTGQLPDPSAFNSVYVLGQNGASLEVVGQVSPIATGEDIRAARFVEDRGFVVSFKKTDPLFVLDLADPTSPHVVGELQVPGFSTYIHMIDANHLLTIGYDAQDEGSYAWFQGIQLQLFDVTDSANPTLLHKHVIGTRGTSSEAATNHLAFNYYAPLSMLAIPMAVCEGSGGGGNYGDVMTFNGLMVFDVSLTNGITEHGRIAHDLVPDDGYGSGCSHWWAEPGFGVQRSIFMENFLYSIAPSEIIAAQLDDLSTSVSSVPLSGTPTGT